MVLFINGNAGSGKTKEACRYAKNRGPIILFDFDRGFDTNFHAPDCDFKMIVTPTSLSTVYNIIKQVPAKSVIIDSLSCAVNMEPGVFEARDSKPFEICVSKTFETLEQIIDFCNDQDIDLYITQHVHKNRNDFDHVILNVKDVRKNYPNITLPDYISTDKNKFDRSNVFTALDLEDNKVKVGEKGYFGNTIGGIKCQVREHRPENILTLGRNKDSLNDGIYLHCAEDGSDWQFFYRMEEI